MKNKRRILIEDVTRTDKILAASIVVAELNIRKYFKVCVNLQAGVRK